MRLSQSLLVAACLLQWPSAWALGGDTEGVIGTWRGPENSIIRIAPCGGTLCAQVLSTGDETAARVDSNNPDAALRTRPLCGLQIGAGFHGSDPNKAEGGHLYDPRTGKTYKGSMTSEGDVLLLRGYVGVSMFGRTARWSRAQEPVEMCSAKPAPGMPRQPAAAPTPAVPNPAAPTPAAPTPTAPAPVTPTPTAPTPAAPQPAQPSVVPPPPAAAASPSAASQSK